MKKDNIRLTGFLLKILEKVLSIEFEIKGEENIPKDKPILFCANHFTRFETFVLPYILSKIPNLKYTRSLAYKDLFFGKLGEYLRSVKVVSTDDKNRDEIIINDLINNTHNWIIYPEGKMMKDKKIFTSKPYFFKKYKMLKTSARTGASVLAMKAEIRAENKGEIQICPITISYRPMHAKRSKLYLLIKSFFRFSQIPHSIKEEMFFESSLLAFSTISIQFHQPIEVKKQLDSVKLLTENAKLEYLRYPLTNRIMHSIYINTPLTFDHFFAFSIFCFVSAGILEIKVEALKEVLFNMIATAITQKPKLQFATSIAEFRIAPLLLKDDFEMLNEAMKEMELKGLGKLSSNKLSSNVFTIDKERFLEKHPENEVRLKNIFSILLNEVFYFKQFVKMLEKTVLKTEEILRKENGLLLFKLLEQDYLKEQKSSGIGAKPLEVGTPRLNLEGEIGVLFCHGFKASPMEMAQLHEGAVKHGFTSYSLRLKGHGTTAEEMQKYKMEDWLLSHALGFEALSRVCKQVFVCGFSMGGLLGVINAERFNYGGLITISSPLKIADFRFYLAGAMSELSSILKSFNKKDYVLTKPENPDTNYNKNYFSALNELKRTINLAQEKLKSINIPTLVIQGMGDRTVSPTSGLMIYKNLPSARKELFEIEAGNRHVIVKGEGAKEVFAKVMSFITRNKYSNLGFD
jgi:esterase/lipase/1-acyl-sn-glycerol-3-phosphate acyltransferase